MEQPNFKLYLLLQKTYTHIHNFLENDSAATWIALFAFFFMALLSFHFPFMFDDSVDLAHAEKGFAGIVRDISDFSYAPRLFFLFLYVCLYKSVGFHPIYYHLFKALVFSLFIFVYYHFATLFLQNKFFALVAVLLVTLTPQTLFTTIWYGDIVTFTLLFHSLFFFLFLKAQTQESKKIYLIFAAVLFFFSMFLKENSVILLPTIFLFLCFCKFQKQKIESKNILFFISLFLMMLIFVFLPKRPVFFSYENIFYFLKVLAYYYTPLLLLLFFWFTTQNILKWKTISQETIILFCWVLAASGFLLFSHNQEERYIVEILAPFVLLLTASIREFLSRYESRKIVQALFLCVFLYFTALFTVEAIHIEYGWGSHFRAVDEIRAYLNEYTTNSLIYYQSVTPDFYQFQTNNTYIPIGQSPSETDFAHIPTNYSHVFYISYPAQIQEEANDSAFVSHFERIRSFTEGPYTYDLYEPNQTNTVS